MARRLSVGQSRLSNWIKRNSVPEFYCASLEIHSRGAVHRWDFFPADWHVIWPELVGTPGAPAVPTEKQEASHA